TAASDFGTRLFLRNEGRPPSISGRGFFGEASGENGASAPREALALTATIAQAHAGRRAAQLARTFPPLMCRSSRRACRTTLRDEARRPAGDGGRQDLRPPARGCCSAERRSSAFSPSSRIWLSAPAFRRTPPPAFYRTGACAAGRGCTRARRRRAPVALRR